VPHVELSLTEIGPATPRVPSDLIEVWAQAVTRAAEPSLVIDAAARVVAMSPSCLVMLGLTEPPIGQPLNGGALRLIDFSAQGGALTDNEIGKIPPLLSLSSGRLARGLIRIDCDGSICTLDAIATPIGEPAAVVGSLTFFSSV
jgi:hypothetical protein